MNELINPLAWKRARADASSRRYGGNELPSEMIALEPRVMLDGAIALAATEEAPADDNAAGDDKGATGEPAAQQAQNSETEANAENSGTTPETEVASGTEPGKTIVIVDAAVADPAALLEGIDPSADVFYLVAGADGVEQISNILAGQSNVSSLHVLSHGDTGSVTIGTTTLTLSNIETYAADFVGWDVALADGADILLYGCNVAEDQSGLDFIDLFAELTHTDVAASTDLTGGDAVGGDWVLEAQTGAVDTPSPLNTMALAGYQHTLVFEEIGDNDFRISEVGSSGAPAGSALRPEVAYNSTDNEYLVVWRGSEPDLLSGSAETEIFGRRVDAATGIAIGPDFRISDVDGDGNTGPKIRDLKVAYNSVDNEYLVVWDAEDPDFGLEDSEFEIFGQRIDADGSEIGVDFRISDAGIRSASDALKADIAYNSVENEYLVVWHADDFRAGISTSEFEIFGQRIDGATGDAIGVNDFRISSAGPDNVKEIDAFEAAVAFNSTDNEYLVVWHTRGLEPEINSSAIYGQRLSGVDGSEIGTNDFRISESSPEHQSSRHPDVAYNPDQNQYLVIWQGDHSSAGLDSQEYEVFGQRLTASGDQTGTNDFRISDVGGTGDADFSVDETGVVYNAADQEYLVVWESSDTGVGLTSESGVFFDTYEIEIFGQRLNAQTGVEVGNNDFLISDVQGIGQTVEGSVGNPALAYNSTDSEILVVWHARDFDDTGALGISQGIFGQRLADLPPNEAPVHSVPGPQFANQGDTLNFNEANGTTVSVNDADAGAGQITTTVTLDPGLAVVANPAFDSLSGTGAAGDPFVLTKTGTIAEVNAALAQLVVTVNTGTGGQTLAVTLSTDDGGNTGSGGAQTTVDVISVNVETANTAPTLSGLNGAPTFTEGGSAILIDADVSVGDGEQNWNGGTLTVSGLDAADTVAVRDSGTGAGQTSLSGANIIVDGRIVASFAGGASGTNLVITFTAGAGNTAVATILENLIYSNSSDAPATERTLSFALVDGAGATATGSGPSYVERSGAANPFEGLFTGFYQRPTFGDIDNDGDLDAFVGDTTGAIRFFRNDGSASAPDFVDVTGAGNPFDGLDLGQNARPELADIDADGDLDLFVATTTKTYFYRNTGTSAVPNYVEEIGTGPLLDGSTQVNGTLAFADIDNDGDLDAFAGIANGRTEFYRNTGTASAPAFTAISGAVNPLNGIDVGIGATPSFTDYDGDGDLDAFIGASSGAIRYFRNDGDAADANFRSISGSRNPLNHVATGDTAIPVFADIDNDGDLDAFVGRSSSPSLFYESVPFNQIIASVAAVNDTPSVVAPTAGLTAVDQVGLNVHGAGFTAADIDAAAGTVTATLAVTEGTLAVNTGDSGVIVANPDSASVTVTGTIGQIDNLLTGNGTGTIVYTAIAAPSASTTITVTVNDGGNTGRDPETSGDANSEEASASQTIANTLSNTAPTLAGLDGAPIFTEGGAPVLIDAEVAVGDTEQNWDGGTAEISGLDGSDTVAIRNLGNGPGETNIAGTTISVGMTPVATFAGGVAGTNLVVTFNAAATNADVEAVLENLVYSNATDAPAATRTLTITLTDSDGADVSGDVVATVDPVNDAPETNAATGVGAEDSTSISIALSGSDIDGTVASFRIASLPSDGTLFSDAALNNPVALNDTITASGNAATLFFVPNLDFTGTPTFTFAAIDGLGLEDASPAIATITVSAVNDAPQTSAATGSGAEDAPSISMALSGTDIDGNVASFRITGLPADGTLFSDAALNNPVVLNDTISATANAATLFFVPNPDFAGTPTFTFAAIDNLGLEDASPAIAAITVSAVNDAPQTTAATGTGVEDATSISVALAGTDVDGNVASFRITSLPPDGTLFSDAALNDPVALNDTIAATGNTATLFFVPNPNFSGAPTFNFAAVDDLGLEDTSPATATITVSAVNDAPQTTPATGTGVEDATSISVALSGTDVDGTVASFRVTGLPLNGKLFSDAALNNPVALNDTITATGNAATLFFVPNPDFNGTPTFTFAAIDDLGLEDASPAIATITVGAVNDAPLTAAATGTGAEDATSISMDLSGTDVDGTVASFRITSLPSDGTLFSDAALNNPVALNDTIAATANAATLFFVPDPDFNGTPTFTFAAIDDLGQEDESPATATITVSAVNDAPQTADVTGSGTEDAPSISVALSGSDVDGTVASFQITSLPADGTLFSDAALNNPVALNDTIAATGNAATLFFVPNPNFSGAPTFNFAAVDDLGLEDTSPATATITVGAVNDAPQTAGATGNDAEDAPSISVALSGTDVDGTVASFKITSLPADGTLFSDAALNNPVALNDTIAATANAATLFFVPNPDFNGTPTFTFSAIDNLGLEDASPATATITVNAVNDAPQTTAATGTGAEDATSISVALSGTDVDGTVASFRVTSLPSDGTLFSDAALNNPVALNETIAATGNAATLFFVPDPNFTGTPTFTFSAVDNLGLEDASPATATITVNAVNDAPQTTAATGTGAEDATSISVALSGTDVDGTVASFKITSLPADGTLFSDAALNSPVALNDTIAATGNAATLFFVPNPDFNGTPTFTFAAIDNLGLEDASPATATITVNAANDAPQTIAATGTGAEDAPSISVALSGTDVDGTVASFRVTSLPSDGTLFSDAALNNPVALNDTIAATGNAATLFFVPNPNFSGAPTFTFAAIDDLGLEDTSPATATITVSTVNDAPQTANATGAGAEDATSISVALSGTDVDGTVASFRITSLPSNGTLFSDAALNNPVALSDTVAATGNAATLFFVPNPDFNGTPAFTFAAIDNLGLEDASPATATITINAVNDAPETNPVTAAGEEDAASISVALLGSDVDGNVASFRITSLPSDGTLFSDAALNNPVALNDTIIASGNAATLFFVPNPNFSGTPTFNFAAIDNLGLEDATPATATINVGANNDAPETNSTVAVGAEDAASISVAITGTDIDGTVAFFRVTSLPSDGTLFSDAALNNPVALNDTIAATGNAATLFFVPNPNFNGTPTFTFAAIDEIGLEDASPATAAITVGAVNDTPQTAVATGTGDEDATSISVALSGTDVDGTVASFRITSLPSNGTLFSDAALNNPVALSDTVAATGNAATLFFVPNPDFNGTPTFTFSAIDNLGLEDASPATATITVNAVNDAPQTTAATGTGAEDATSISVALSGTDVDGTVASFRVTSLPSDGTLFSDAALNNPVALNDTFAATGNAATLFFVPNPNFNGTPTFTFAAIDEIGLEDASPATAAITVGAVNDTPQTAVATGTGDEDATSISVALSGTDVDGTVASFRVTSLPSDGTLFSDAALNNPVALNETITATGNAATLFFVPNPDFNGTPTFTFSAIDNLGLEDASPATATITVEAINDAPETNPANAAGDEDAASISVDLSGTDIDGTVASFKITSLPSDGTLYSDAALNNPVALNATIVATNNAVTLFFMPNADFNGVPSFTFAAIDDLGLQDDISATATITVNSINDAPETGAAVAAGNEDAASISVNLSGGDIDGNVAGFRITGMPADGVLFSDAALNNPVALNDTVAAAGNAATLFFVPNADFNGMPTFTFSAIDDLGLEDATPATATITVNPVNDAPDIANLASDVANVLAGGDATAIDFGTNATVSNLDGAADFNGGFMTFDITAGTDNGSFSFDGVGVTSGGDATISANETIRVGGTVIGTVSAVAGQDGQTGNVLRIDFDAGSAAPASLSTMVRSLHYTAPSGFGDRTLTTTLNDGDGTANGGADESVVVSTIRVPVAPQVQSIERQDPASDETNADSVTFRITFDTDVSNVDANDFALSGTLAATSSVTGVTRISATVYDVAVDVPDNGDGTINLDISAAPSVQNGAGINIHASAMSLGADETYSIDNSAPAVPLADLAAASDRGASETDDITNDTTPTITGTVDANTTVTILSSIDGKVGEDSAAAYNDVGIDTSALSDGVHTLTILSTDVAGNSSMTQLTITIDTIAPTATSIGSPIAPADDAVVTFSETISLNDAAATFMTTLNAGAVVQDNFLATNANTSLSGGNTLTFARPTALALGSTFSAQIGAGMVTDVAGNTNAALTDFTTLVFETFAVPAAPAGLDLIELSDTGQSRTDDITADATPTITGTADANATINLTSSLDGLVGTIQADADGDWSITTSTLRDGVHDLTATATNPATIGPASAILSVTVDTTIRTPATPDLTDASDTGASPTDNVTFDRTPTLTGTAEAGATVTLTSSISGTVGTAVANAAGTWTMTAGTLPAGDHVFAVRMVDIAGNVSPQSPGLTVTIATETTGSTGNPGTGSAPDDGQSSTGTGGSDIAALGNNNDGASGQSGDGSPGSNFDPSSTAIGSGFTGQNNQDGGLPPAGRAPQGADPIITAGLGEQRPLSGDVLSESDLPGSITLDPASDSGFSNSDNRTNENQPVFIGEAPANSIVTITSSLGGVIGTARVDATGKWTFQSPALADGEHELIATPVDEDGNNGVPSIPLLVTIDTNAPETPAPPAVDGDIDQFRVDEIRTFKGKAEPGARIVLTSDQDGVVGEVIADENGNWEMKGDPLSENAHVLTVTATDEAGNASAPSQALSIVVRGADDTALNFDAEDPIHIDLVQVDDSVAFDAVDMTVLLKGFTRDIEGFEQAQMENTTVSQAVGFTRQLQRADAERMFT